MKPFMRAVALAAAAFIVSFTAPAHAVPLTPNPADFSIVESPGQYTVYNNSTDWYIYAFAVSNPAADGGDAWTGFSNWSGHTFFLDLNTGEPVPAFAYASEDTDLDNIPEVALPTPNLDNYIGPGMVVSDFYFSPALIESHYGMLMIHSDGVSFGEVNGVSGTPLPGAVWLLGTVLAGGVGVSRWRKRKGKGNRQELALSPAAA